MWDRGLFQNGRRESGVALLEVTVAILVLSIGVLGTTSLQLAAKRVGFEAVQRTAAVSLANSMVERMRNNPGSLASYNGQTVGGQSIGSIPTPDCRAAVCTGLQMAALDLWEWEQAIDGATETREVSGSTVLVGGLLNPTGCVSVSAGTVTIAMAWEGYQSLTNPSGDSCGAGVSKYGLADAKRQVLTMSTFITEE